MSAVGQPQPPFHVLRPEEIEHLSDRDRGATPAS
jgi:hypothetical protein